MSDLKQEIIAIAREHGIDKVGFTSRERLAAAPPSGDLTYVLPSARSAVSLVVALDHTVTRAYLAKEDQVGHSHDQGRAYAKLKEAAHAIQRLLVDKGHEVHCPQANFQYRKDLPPMTMAPPLSHRYVAVASGLGWIGWSGNVFTPEYGAAVCISSVVTSAELGPDPMLAGEPPCKSCRLCAAVCPSYFISRNDETSVSIGGRDHSYHRKVTNMRCLVTCGGANGARAGAEWSTWSHRVLDLPGRGEDEAFQRKVFEYRQRPNSRLLNFLLDMEQTGVADGDWDEYDRRSFEMTFSCSYCMLICWPSMEDRRKNYRMVVTSGKVFKDQTGLKVVRA
ncbi:MAG: epoxyqueuosine reductase [Chloroflexota bacterium]|nr:MAG: epoxyqueuosine reductase [Chloroflexota bacterium]